MPNLPINDGAWRGHEFAIGMGSAPKPAEKQEHVDEITEGQSVPEEAALKVQDAETNESDVEQLKAQYKKAAEKMAYFQSIATTAESARVQCADELSRLQDQIYRSAVGFDNEKIKSYDHDEALKNEYSEGRESGLKTFADRKSEIDHILEY